MKQFTLSKFKQPILLSSFLLLSISDVFSQDTKRVLFIGNSYTGNNNLPFLVSQVATSAGDNLIYDSNTPGGQTFQGHSNNTATLSKIAQGNWDHVVLQEQSQLPSFGSNQVANMVLTYGKKLDSLIHVSNPCAITNFYMTWGRKFGDPDNCQFIPDLCTYEGMDDRIKATYLLLAQQNDAITTPVGAVWRYLRTNHPTIELYTSDNSHPTLAGSYAAACAFYSSIFRKSPLLITTNSNLDAATAQIIRNAAKTVVFDQYNEWYINEYDPTAAFAFNASANTVVFQNESEQAINYAWNFGDGTTSTLENPTHTYSAIGTYNVELIVSNCHYSDTIIKEVNIQTLGLNNLDASMMTIYPNPFEESFTISNELVKVVSIVDPLGKAIPYEQIGKEIHIRDSNTTLIIVTFELNGQLFMQRLNKL